MPSKSAKQTTFLIFGAFVVLIGLLLVAIPPLPKTVSGASIGVAAVGAAICLYCSFARMLPAGQAPKLLKFQPDFLIALAGAELVMLAGTFMGPGPQGPWPFAVASWGLMFGAILPKLIRFWRLTESQPS